VHEPSSEPPRTRLSTCTFPASLSSTADSQVSTILLPPPPPPLSSPDRRLRRLRRHRQLDANRRGRERAAIERLAELSGQQLHAQEHPRTRPGRGELDRATLLEIVRERYEALIARVQELTEKERQTEQDEEAARCRLTEATESRLLHRLQRTLYERVHSTVHDSSTLVSSTVRLTAIHLGSGRYVDCNSVVENMFGVSRHHLIGTYSHIWQLVKCRLEQALVRGSHPSIWSLPTGESRDLEVAGAPQDPDMEHMVMSMWNLVTRRASSVQVSYRFRLFSGRRIEVSSLVWLTNDREGLGADPHAIDWNATIVVVGPATELTLLDEEKAMLTARRTERSQLPPLREAGNHRITPRAHR